MSLLFAWAVLGTLTLADTRLDGATLSRFDLATLYERADLIVLVKNFRPSEKNQVGTGFVKKVHKGDYPVGQAIRVLPWAIDFSRTSGIPTGQLPETFDALFFLVKQPDHRVWETLLSGMRIVIGKQVLGVQATGPVSYAIVKAASERLSGRTQPYDYDALVADLAGTTARLRAVEAALEAPPTGIGLAQLQRVLTQELERGFPSTTRSDLVWRLVQRLAEWGKTEELWRWRDRVPRAAMGREVDHLLARNVNVEFFRRRIVGKQQPNDLRQVLSFIAANSFPLNIEVQGQLLEWLIDWAPQYPVELQSIAFEATSEILDVIPVTLTSDVRLKVLRTARRGNGAARFYLGPTVLTKYPRLAAEHFESPLRLFGHIRMNQHKRTQLVGEVKLRRLRSQFSLSNPRLVCERVTKAGAVLERHDRFLSIPNRLLKSGYVGRYYSGFSWSFRDRPLGSGEWCIYLEIETSASQQPVWQTEYSTFIVRD